MTPAEGRRLCNLEESAMISDSEESRETQDPSRETGSIWDAYQDDDIEPPESPETEVGDESQNGPPSGP